MEIDPPTPSSAVPIIPYADYRAALLSALSLAISSLPRRASEKAVRDALERHLAPHFGSTAPASPEAVPNADAEDKLAAVKKQRAGEMRKVLDSQGWRIELGKIMETFAETNYDPLFNLLDAVLVSSELGYSDINTPLVIIEEVMDVVTIEATERIFDFIELRSDRLTHNMSLLPTKGRSLTMLRVSNELLRRLSRTQNTVYSGRILMYLSSVYPLSERSGVNLHGDFNKDNVTHYEGEGIEDDDDMMTEEGGEGVSEEEKEARFYRRFWGMQKFLSNPPSIFGEGNFERLRTGVEATLAKFEKIGTGEVREAPAPSRPQESASRKRKQRPDDKVLGKAETFFFPKFLTSPKVFDLELRDPQFPRHILVQLLIIFQYLVLQSTRERERLQQYTAKAPSTGGAKQAAPAYSLSEQSLAWVEGTKTRCNKMIEAIPGNGRAFLRTVVQTLSHEKAWIKWKNESCLGFERPGLPLDPTMATKRRKAEPVPPFLRKEAWLATNAPSMDPLASLKSPLNVPTLDSYMADIRADLDEYELKEERRSSDPRVQWKTWRLVRGSGMPAFIRLSTKSKDKEKIQQDREKEKERQKEKSKDQEKDNKDTEREKSTAGASAASPAVTTPGGTSTPLPAESKDTKESMKEVKEVYPDLERYLVEYESTAPKHHAVGKVEGEKA